MKLFNCKTCRFVVVLSLLFFTLLGCEKKPQQPSLQRIVERGYVAVGTLFGPTSYYLDAESAAGFEYELAKMYADSLGVELKVFPSYSLEELFFKLDSGQVDVLAAGLAVTPEREKKYKFSPRYDRVSQKLVFKQGNIRPRTLSDLSGKLMVMASSSHGENLTRLQATNPALHWQESAEFDSEELLLKVLDGSIDYTIIDSNVLAVNRRYYPEISVGFTIKEPEPLAWLINASEHSIMASLVEFFGQVHGDGTLAALDDKYYGHVEEFNYVDTRLFIEAVEKKLPKYQPLFEKYSQDIDWRLLAALSYQESHWKPHARSYTGVRGMMMLTLATAKQMGVKSRLDAEQSIRGGVKYFKQMIDRIPDRIPSPDNVWFALAAYNVGLGHLHDARKITKQQGGDPDRWVEVKSRLPLLRQKKYYKNTKYGYARGDEAVKYVEHIRRYYDTLSWLDDKVGKEKTQLKPPTIEQSERSNSLQLPAAELPEGETPVLQSSYVSS